MANTLDTLASAVARLTAAPTDLTAWLDTAWALENAAEIDESTHAFERLGVAACATGQVALAVASVKWLADNDRRKQAESLLQRIASTHCRGSAKLDHNSRNRPPKPPTVPPEQTLAPPKNLQAAVSQARDAIAIASRTIQDTAPDKHSPAALVSQLTPSDFQQLVSVMQLTRRAAGDQVIEIGERALNLFWIARGQVTAYQEDHELGELRSNAFFGEIALVGGTTRTATVTCTKPTSLLEIPADSIEAAAQQYPQLGESLAIYARSRLLRNVMRTSELFSRLDTHEHTLLLSRLATRLVARDETIISRGAENDTLYVVVSGTCEVRKDGAVVASLGVGEAAGEMSLLSRKPASADVIATEQSVLLSLSRTDFDDIAIKHPGLLAEVYKLVVEREQHAEPLSVADASDLIL